jgi:signal peptidase I
VPSALIRVLAFGSIVVALLLVIVGGGVALTGHRVVGDSMAPTLADGELLAANPFDHGPARFDVVLLRASESATGTQALVKRVIGLPGDRIEIVPATRGPGPMVRVSPAGSVGWSQVRVVAGALPWRTRIECCTPDGRTSFHPAPATVPAGRYFVLGDNPDASIDSRAFGFTAPDAVRGVVVGRLWPLAALPETGYRLDPVN